MKSKKLISGLMCSVMALSATLSSFSATVSAVDTHNDEFTNLNQSEIVKDMGAGWNVGNQLEANSGGTPNETAWVSTKITKELIQAVKDQGFNTVRVPVSYLSKIGSAPDYTIDTAWLDRIQEVVNYCYELDMYVILNMHGDGYTTIYGGWLLCNASDKKQVEIKEKYKACWQQIANRFKGYDEHLIFESMNEEFDGKYNTPNRKYYQNINDYNQIFVDTVRQTGENNTKRWLLIPGWNTDIEYTVGDYGFALPTDNYRDSSIPKNEQRIMISVHYYNPWSFCGEEKTGISTTWGTDSQIKEIKNQFTRCYLSFVAKGYPVVIGEYGSIDRTASDATNNSSRALYASEVCKAARSRGMIPVYWDNGYNGDKGFGLFDRATYKVTQQGIIDAIMKAFEGDPEPFDVASPITKDQALAVIYHVDDDSNASVLASGTADASMAGAVKARYVFDCASDVAFNQYTTINLESNVAGTESKAKVYGDADASGATKCTAVLDLANPIKSGDKYSFSVYTKSWSDAKDYVFLIRCIELLDANGNVIKTIDKSSIKTPVNPSNNNTTKTPVKTTKTPAATRDSKKVAADKKAAQKAMKQAKLTSLKVKSKAKKKINVTWKKVKKAKGYQVQVSTKKNFKKVIFKKDLKKTKLNIKNKKIKSKKTYYVRVRAYATYKDKNNNTIKVYSKWNKKLRKITVK